MDTLKTVLGVMRCSGLMRMLPCMPLCYSTARGWRDNMADFCQQCSLEMFGMDFRELAELGPKGSVLPPEHGWTALCEGCGPTLVDQDGKCIAAYCPEHGSKAKGVKCDRADCTKPATRQPQPPYKEWCRHPEKCAGLASCPQDLFLLKQNYDK